MVTLDTVAESLVRELTDAPLSLIREEALKACIEFLSRTKAWKVPCSFMAIAGEREVTLVPDKAGDIVKADVLRTHWGDVRDITVLNGVSGLCLMREPAPETCGGRGLCSLTPKRSALSLEDDVWNLCRDAIRYGTVYRVRSIAGKEFFNADIMAYTLTQFEREVAKMAADVVTGYLNSPFRTAGQWI